MGGNQQGSYTVKTASMGASTREPHKCQEMLKWLAQRGLDYAAFKRWQNDDLPRKFYFPLVTEVREARLVRLLVDKGQVLGGLLRLEPKDAPPGEDEDKAVAKEEELVCLFEGPMGDVFSYR